MKTLLPLNIQPQPTDTSCGPTCLAAVYRYWGHSVDLPHLIETIGELPQGGTLAVHLGCDALRRGFQAHITTFNLHVFDPTWFADQESPRQNELLREKLLAQLECKLTLGIVESDRLHAATKAYTDFLSLGGRIEMHPLEESRLRDTIDANLPVLCGLSATYLYHESRERGLQPGEQAPAPSRLRSIADDVGGFPAGHFVVVHGYDRTSSRVVISDPLHSNPFSPTQVYATPFSRLAAAILLGIVTYDANLLVIQPGARTR